MKERIPKLDADNPFGLLFSLAVCSKEKVAPAREFDLPLLFASERFTRGNGRSIKTTGTRGVGARSADTLPNFDNPWNFFLQQETRTRKTISQASRRVYAEDSFCSAWIKKFIFNEVNH